MLYWLLGALGLTGGGIGIAALLGGGPVMLLGVKWLISWLSHATFLQVVCIVLGAAFAVDHIALIMAHRHTAKVETQVGKCTAARASDQASYRNGQATAAAKNKSDVAAKEAQSKKVSDDERQAYLDDLAKLRADDQRMRQQVAAASGRTGPANPPTPSAPASGADANGLPLSPDDHLRAAEIELRLMHLQRWVLGQLAIDPNKEGR